MLNHEKRYGERQWSPTTERNVSVGVAAVLALVVLINLFVGPGPRVVWEQGPETTILGSGSR
jgi:hypothetical protein